jgi:DNA-binding NtrC family response regulator
MPSDAPRPRVLFVEDAADLRRAYERYFAGRYEMAFAGTGAEAIRLTAEFQPNVVVLDLRLPDTDGIEVLQAVRERAPDIKAVITSAYSSMEPMVEVLGLRYNRFLIKPFELPDLQAAIDADE